MSGTTVGSIAVVMTGESIGLERAMGAAEQKLATMEARSAKAAAAVAGVSNRVDELRDKQALLTKVLNDAANATERDEAKMQALRQELEATTQSLGRLTTVQSKGSGGLKAFEERMGKASGALAAMSSALGSGESQTAKWGQAIVGIAGAFAAGGPVGAGIAAGAAAIEYLNAKMVASEKAAAALEEQFNKIVDAARAVRDATASRTVSMERDIITSNVVSTAGSDRESQIFEQRQRLAFELEDSGRRVKMMQESLISQQRAMVGLEGDKLVAAQSMEEALRTQVALGQQNTTELGKQFAKIPDLVDAHMKIAKAAEARARAEEAAARALDRQYLHFMKDVPPVNMRGVMAATSAAGVAGAVGSAGGYTDLVEQQLMSEPAGDPNRFTAILVDEQQKYADELAETINGLADAHETRNNLIDAQADAAAALLDMKSAAEKASQAQWENTAEAVAGTAASGSLSGATSMIGGIAGSAAGNMIVPGIGGAIGGGLGSAVGGMLGSLAEQLVDALGILTPVFDSLGVVVAALSPIFLVVGVLFSAVGGVIESLAPFIAQLADVVAALLMPLVHGAQFWMIFVSMVVPLIAAFSVLSEVVISVMSALDTYFYRPLVSWAATIFNSFVDFYNGIIIFIRNLEIAGKKPLGDFGVLMDGMSTNIPDVLGDSAKSMADLRDVLGPTADAAKEFGRSMTNVPSWYRVPLAEYRAAGGTGGQGGSGGGSSYGSAGVAINGNVTFVMQDSNIAQAVRKGLMKMRGVPVGGPRRSNDDESN